MSSNDLLKAAAEMQAALECVSGIVAAIQVIQEMGGIEAAIADLERRKLEAEEAEAAAQQRLADAVAKADAAEREFAQRQAWCRARLVLCEKELVDRGVTRDELAKWFGSALLTEARAEAPVPLA
jgi:hypothetical protein